MVIMVMRLKHVYPARQPIIQHRYRDAGLGIDWIEKTVLSIIKDGTSPFCGMHCKWFTHLCLAAQAQNLPTLNTFEASSVQIIYS